MSARTSALEPMEGTDTKYEYEKDDISRTKTQVETVSQEPLYEEGSIDPIYQAKAHLLNSAIQEIGMGRYQVGRTVMVS